MRVSPVILMLFAMCLPLTKAQAQESKYKFDFGASVGTTGYLGDANNSSLFKHPGFTADINARYVKNTRIAFRGLLGIATLSGNTADMDNVLPHLQNFSFKSTVIDLGARFEFNFLPYGIGETYKRLSRWSPYLILGVGVCLASSGGNVSVTPDIPMGMGLKFKVSERLNLGAEFTMTKTLGDKIDGPDLNDLTGIKTSFIKNTDWFSRVTIGFSYEFGERCQTCHYVD